MIRLLSVAGMFLLMVGAARAVQVGAYYYPWHGSYPGGHSFNDTLRGHLVPRQDPAIGRYSNRDSATMTAHLDQSHRGNINFWAMSWWGPNSAEDATIRNSILPHSRAGELRYAMFYESTGRLGSFDNPNFSSLTADFRYLAQNYFNNPNYLRIDGRPVVFIYLTRAYFNTPASRTAVANLRQAMLSEFRVDPYLIGDDLFNNGVDPQRAALWDAITDYDVYGTVLQPLGSTQAAVNTLAQYYAEARTAVGPLGVGFIPAATPGFNDRAVRTGHPAAPRYLTDSPGAPEGSLFEKMLEEAVLPNLDAGANDMLMITSFNEWHEDTQIEPTIVAPPTSIDNSGENGMVYTQGRVYPGYGNLYLDILARQTVPEPTGRALASVAIIGLVLWCARSCRKQTAAWQL